MNLFSCDQHKDTIIVHTPYTCPMCELESGRDRLEANAEDLQDDLDEAGDQIKELEREVARLEKELGEK